MTAPWIGEALRAGGLPVIEEPGCMDRGTGGLFTPLGVLMHHTAGSANGNLPSLGIVRDGRPDLQGPLSQLMLARDGTFHFIAAGRANHAGVGSAWFVPGSEGNRYLIGIEAESTGVRDDWTDAQRVNYPRGVAALLRWMGKDERYAIGHKEWAPTRKVDPAFWDMNAFRGDVRDWLSAAAPKKGLFMALTEAQELEILEAARSVLFGKPGVRNAGDMALAVAALKASALSDEEKRDLIEAARSSMFGTTGKRNAGELALFIYGMEQRVAKIESLLCKLTGDEPTEDEPADDQAA